MHERPDFGDEVVILFDSLRSLRRHCRTRKARKAARFTCSVAYPIIPTSSRTEADGESGPHVINPT